jgi:hypothetical protein
VAAWFSPDYWMKPRSITGSVVDFQAGRSIAVAIRPDDETGIQFTLRNTAFDVEPQYIGKGMRVVVTYRVVGEKNLVASEVRVLNRSNR